MARYIWDGANWVIKSETKAAARSGGSVPPGAIWRTIRGARVLIGSDGAPVDPAWRERLGGGRAAATVAPGARRVKPKTEPVPPGPIHWEQRNGENVLTDGRGKPVSEFWRRQFLGEDDSPSALSAPKPAPKPKAEAKPKAETASSPDSAPQSRVAEARRAMDDALEAANNLDGGMLVVKAQDVWDAVEAHRPAWAKVDKAANAAVFARQEAGKGAKLTPAIKQGQQFYIDHLSTAALTERLAARNESGFLDNRKAHGVLPTVVGGTGKRNSGEYRADENSLAISRETQNAGAWGSNTYVHEMGHWLADTKTGAAADLATWRKMGTGEDKVVTEWQGEVAGWQGGVRFVRHAQNLSSNEYASQAYARRDGRDGPWRMVNSEAPSTAIEEFYRNPRSLARDDPDRFRLAVALLWGAPALEAVAGQSRKAAPWLWPVKAAPKGKPKSGERWVTIQGSHVLIGGDGLPVDPVWRTRLAVGAAGTMTPPDGRPWDGQGEVRQTRAGAEALAGNLEAWSVLYGDNAFPPDLIRAAHADPMSLAAPAKPGTPGALSWASATVFGAALGRGNEDEYTSSDRMEKRLAAKAGLKQRDVTEVTREWANNGPNEGLGALELCKAAEAEFGVPASPWADNRLQTMRRERRQVAQTILDKVAQGQASGNYPYDVNPYEGQGWHGYPMGLEENRITGEVLPKRLQAIAAGTDKPPISQATQRKALRAMYDLTQEDLKRVPGDTVTLYRGINWPTATPRPDTPGGAVELTPLSAPLSSWTVDPETARRFGNVVIAAKVPKRRILSTPHSGLGTIFENEVVVLGGTGDQGQIWATSPYHGFVKSLAGAVKAAKPKAGERWVTIRGTHVLIGSDGTPRIYGLLP